MFIYVALRGPRCPHMQRCVEMVTAGHNTNAHQLLPSSLGHGSGFPPKFPKLVFFIQLWERSIPYSVATLAVIWFHALFIVTSTYTICSLLDASTVTLSMTFPPSHPPGSPSKSCQAWRRVTSGMENYYSHIIALPFIYSQMACWF